jgi:hypothetical protein
MPIAYCIVAHNRPSQLVRLVHRLFDDDPSCLVVLHYDQRAEPFDVPTLAHPRVRVVRQRPIYWGGPEVVEVMVDMLRVALSERCGYAVLLSGQDYPVGAVTHLEARLSQFDVWAEMRSLFAEDGSCASEEGRGRYGYRWWHLNDPAKWVRGLDRCVSKLLGEPSYRRPPPLPYLVHMRQRNQVWWGIRSRGPGVPVHVGGQWMSLSARAMEAVCSSDGKVRSFFRHVPVADEACLHTILANAGALSFAPGNERFIRWVTGSPSPEILTVRDLELIASSGCHFARKFDELVDSTILDRLDLLAKRQGAAPTTSRGPRSATNN